MPKKFEYSYVFNYFEKQNCKLLSKDYLNNRTHLRYICKCGNKSIIIFSSFKQGHRCRQCFTNSQKLTFEYVFDYFKQQGCVLLSKEYYNSYNHLDYICKCGNKSSVTFNNFKHGHRCSDCGGTEKHTFEYVFNYFKQNNCTLLSKEYLNNCCKLNYICKCGNENSVTFKYFQQRNNCRCKLIGWK